MKPLKSAEQLTQEWEDEKKRKEEAEPSFIDTSLAAVRTSLTGGNTFLNMVERKHVMPSNEGAKDFHLSDEFKNVIKESGYEPSLNELSELRDARNADYLRAKLKNQDNYKEAIKTIEKDGISGMVTEGVMSIADVPSWIVGGAIFKTAKAGETALKIQSTGAKWLYNMANSGISAGSSIYTTESIIQSEAGVDMTERKENTAKYGAMFGIALPLIGQAFTSVATGEGRRSLASNSINLIENFHGKGSVRGFFSLSTADQLRYDSVSPTARGIGEAATTPVTAAKDGNGNFITSDKDTAMDYVETTVESSLTDLHYGAYNNSQTAGTRFEDQSLVDGKEWNDFTNGVEQTIRRETGAMSNDELTAIYKEATGIDELPIEKAVNKAEETLTNAITQADAKAAQELGIINTQKQNLVNKFSSDASTLKATKQRQQIRNIKAKETALTKKYETNTVKLQQVEDELKGFTVTDDGKVMVSMDGAYKELRTNSKQYIRYNKLRKDADLLRTTLDKQKADLDTYASNKADLENNLGKLDDQEIASLAARADSELQTSVNLITRNRDKAVKIAQAERDKLQPGFKDLPEDILDVVSAHLRKKKFDDGTFVVPPHLQYIQDFYSKFGDEATKYGLKGIAGKESRGYGHIKYNTDEILSDVAEAERKFKEMLRDDELNKALLARGEITEADIESIAKSMVEKALDRDFKHRYIDGGRGSQATSATSQRKLRMNRSLHPELFVNDIETIGLEYADRIGGKIGLKKTYGIDTDNLGRLSTQFEEVYKKIEMEGRQAGASERAIKKDIENTRAIFETVLGSRKYAHDPDKLVNKSARLMRKSASSLYNAGFVKYAIVEPTVAIMRYGLGPVVSNFVPAFGQVANHIKNANASDPMVKLMRQAGLAIQTQRGLKYNRYDNLEITPTTGKVEMFMDKVSHVGRKYSGFNYINDTSDWISGGSALAELNTVMTRPTNLSKGEASRMARFGLTTDDLAAINKQNIQRSADGQVTNWNHENWTDQDLAKKFVRYLSRATRDTIMRADGTRVHRWQSDVNNPIAALALQFTQMPVALYERLLLNFGDEASARTFVGIFTAVATMYSILKLEDMAKVSSGISEAEDDTKLLIKAVTRTPIAGIVPNYIDAALMLTGNSPLGSSYAPKQSLSDYLGAGYGVADRAFSTATGVFNGVNGTDAANMLKLAPIINSIPILNLGMKSLQHDLKEGNMFEDQPFVYDKPMYNYLGD